MKIPQEILRGQDNAHNYALENDNMVVVPIDIIYKYFDKQSLFKEKLILSLISNPAIVGANIELNESLDMIKRTTQTIQRELK